MMFIDNLCFSIGTLFVTCEQMMLLTIYVFQWGRYSLRLSKLCLLTIYVFQLGRYLLRLSVLIQNVSEKRNSILYDILFLTNSKGQQQ